MELSSKDELFASVYMNELYKCGVDSVSKSLTVTLLGRSGTGKSYLVSKLIKHEEIYRDLFCGDCGATFCNVVNTISNSIDVESIKFRTNFTAFTSGNNAELANRISHIVNIDVPLDGSVTTKEIVKEMKSLSDEIKIISHGEKTAHIDVFLQPNTYSVEILRNKDRDSIVIIDTPGVSGYVNAPKITESNLYVIMLRSDNEQEAATLQKISQNLEFVIPTGKVLFLYRVEGVINSEDRSKTMLEYAAFEKHAQKEVLAFEKHFSSIRRHVIFTKNELLDIRNSCIAFPTMTTDDRWNSIFLDRLKAVLENSVVYDEIKAMDGSMHSLLTMGLEYDVRKFAEDILNKLPPHHKQNGNFTKLQFRAMAYENMREDWSHDLISRVLSSAYHEEITALYRYFSQYLVGNWKKHEEFIIKYIYYKLRESIDHDYYISVYDSIFAKEILDKCENCPRQDKSVLYTEVMKECKLESVVGKCTWPAGDTFIIRLKIIRDAIGNVTATNASDFVLHTHVCGLRKYAEYAILTTLGMPEEEAMKTIKELPF